MAIQQCPSGEELSGYLVGSLSKAMLDSVSGHVASCAHCQARITTLRGGQTLSIDVPRIPVQATPQQLGNYELLGKIGAGGMGTVYKARHKRLKKIVAIKVLPTDRSITPDALARFDREMEAVGKLDHVNIVRAMDAGEADNVHFLAMEYVEGADLSSVAGRLGKLPVADACEMIRQTAVGLQHAHERQLVHRDIKPSNLLLTPEGQVKILDFGLALLHAPDAPGELTASQQVMGTLDYMPPEQAESTHRVDIRADIYSLGCTLYKLLAGQAPFEGPRYNTLLTKLAAHQKEQPAPVSSRRADLPSGLDGILARMLAKQPAARFATPGEVAAALAPFAAGARLADLAQGVPAAQVPAVQVPAAQASAAQASAAQAATGLAEPHAASTAAVKMANVPTAPLPRPTSAPAPQRTMLWGALAAGGLAAALLVAFLALRGPTPTGSLVVHSPAAGLRILVQRDGQPVRTVPLSPGENRLELAAAHYELALVDAPAGTRLDPPSIRVGAAAAEVRVLQVIAQAQPAADPPKQADPPKPADPPKVEPKVEPKPVEKTPLEKVMERIDKRTEKIDKRTERIDEKTEQIEKTTKKVAKTLDELRANLADAAKRGGLIENPETASEHYHNARLYEQRGDFANARKSYLSFFGAKLDVIDPHLRFQGFLKVQEGAAGAREVYNTLAQEQNNPAQNNLVFQFARLLLETRDDRVPKLEAFLKEHPDFAPGWYELSLDYSAGRLGVQGLFDKHQERAALKKFQQASEAGHFLKYYLDQQAAAAVSEDAQRRLAALATLDDKLLASPISLSAFSSTSGWVINLIVSEPAQEILYRLGDGKDFESTGHAAFINQQTGKPHPLMQVSLAKGAKKQTLQVKYRDIRGIDRGPFDLVFDPAAELFKFGHDVLTRTPNNWVTFRDFNGKMLAQFTFLASYRFALEEIRYGVDSLELTRTLALAPVDVDDPISLPSGQATTVDLPRNAQYVAVQLTFKDGTKSKVQKFEVKP